MSSSSDEARFTRGSPSANNPMQYTLNSRMMVAAIVVLFVVVFFILTLHVYAKWFWRHTPARRQRLASWRRRSRLQFSGQEPHSSANRTVGLDKSVIEALPIFSYKIPSTEEEPLLECAVCLCEFEEDEKGRWLPTCKHSFHTECIDMWFHSHTTCPLCRTVVAIASEENSSKPPDQSTSVEGSTSPLPLLRHGSGSHNVHSSHNDSTLQPYPNNILFWGDHNHVSSQLSSPGIGTGGSASTRSLPQISIEIPRHAEGIATARCLSLSLSRCPSAEADEACSSQQLKSPSIRMSIKRLLSRERSRGRMRVLPSMPGQGQAGEHEEESALTNQQAV
ncbi:hypothetical protein L7F22_009017 [Adiantum nelumboides]|nr:hypothetical protein [Adiantum nelumboides]